MPLGQSGSAGVQSEKRFRIVILALLTVSVAAPAYEADEKHMDDLVRELGGDPRARVLARAILICERIRERADLSAMEIQQ